MQDDRERPPAPPDPRTPQVPALDSITIANSYKGSHPLLAQVPLTVSPFIHLPSTITLPYTYKPLPSTLPPSSTPTSKFVVSPTGHAAHPDEIIASCRALQSHLDKIQSDAERAIREWEEGWERRELEEKRRLAPGWLDRDEKILEPERREMDKGRGMDLLMRDDGDAIDGSGLLGEGARVMKASSEGEELYRAFCKMEMR